MVRELKIGLYLKKIKLNHTYSSNISKTDLMLGVPLQIFSVKNDIYLFYQWIWLLFEHRRFNGLILTSNFLSYIE